MTKITKTIYKLETQAFFNLFSRIGNEGTIIKYQRKLYYYIKDFVKNTATIIFLELY
jgi:hypothetical protein